MSTLGDFSEQNLGKLRVEVARAARHLKHQPIHTLPDPIKVGFIFNNAMLRLILKRGDVLKSSGPVLAQLLYDQIVKAAKA